MSFNFSPKVTTDGLVLFLDVANIKSFDGVNWLDLSRSSNNGSLINSPTYNSSNKGSIIFDGVNESMSFPVTSDFLFLNRSPYTLSVFAKIINANYIFSGLINREYGSPRNGYNFWFYRDNASRVAIASERWAGTGQKVAYVLLDNAQCINVWNHYCVTYDGNNLRFYLNGLLANTAFADGNITNTTGTLQLARRQNDFANVAMSSLQIYNKSLSSDEVLRNYSSFYSRFRN